MPYRGTYGFEVQPNGNLVDDSGNLERLRNLFRDGAIIKEKFGPGDPGDFDHGSWHILCHLAGGAGVYDRSDRRLWVGITHKGFIDEYGATVSYGDGKIVKTIGLNSRDGQEMIRGASLLGFVEGSSCGHVLARGARDSKTVYNSWRRQDFNRSVRSKKDGGNVWEHWCTTRDMRPANIPGNTLLQGYLTLIAVLGGRFVAAVARGRRTHEHPLQICALVKAGVLTEAEATWETMPLPIPKRVQKMLYEARPADYVGAAGKLDWPQKERPCYFMFKRCIDKWNPASSVRADLATFNL